MWMFELLIISYDIPSISAPIFRWSLIFKIPRNGIFRIWYIFILQIIKGNDVLSHISNTLLKIANERVFWYMIDMPYNEFSKLKKLRPFNSITTFSLNTIKESFYRIKFRSIGTDSHFVAINIAHPPFRYTTIVGSSIIIKKHYILFLHSFISL